MYHKREEWAQQEDHTDMDFRFCITGGDWFSKQDKRGRCFDNFLGKTRTQASDQWCRLYHLNLSFRGDVSKYGEVTAKALVDAWMRRMQFFYDIYATSGDPCMCTQMLTG